MLVLLKTAISRIGTNGGTHAAVVPFRDLHVQELTCRNKMSSKKAKECHQWLCTRLFFSCFSTIIQCGTLRTRLRIWFMGCTQPAGYTQIRWTVRGGIVLKMITGTLYTVYSYIHTSSGLRGLTVSVMDAVYTCSFHAFCTWIVTFTFDALPTRMSYDIPWLMFSCSRANCLEKYVLLV